MPLWGNTDAASGYQKPVFANTSNATVASTINGSVANTDAGYGNMMGVSVTEQSNAAGDGPKTTHAGWVSQKIGTGPITGITIVTKGAGINAAGNLMLVDTSPHGQGVANISFTIANTLNPAQASSSNSTSNGLNTVTIVSSSGWSNSSQFSVTVSNASNTTQPTIALTLGGRAGRVNYETIVATGSITGDDTRDNQFFPGT